MLWPIGLLGLFLSICSPVRAGVSPKDNPKIMIVGDSISQGRNGDFTWRYRLWDWLDTNGISTTFVGPYTGTVQQAKYELPAPPAPYSPSPTSSAFIPEISQLGGYNPDIPSSSGFLTGNGRNHLAAWGRQVAQDKDIIEGYVAQYMPDYLLVELGFNDMGWFVSDAQGTLDSMVEFITNARKANPSLAFAVANVPQRSFIGGRDDLITKTDEYNSMLPVKLASMSTHDSPIYLVPFRESYDCEPSGCPVGSDGLHPNALGEFQIAKAFADTLQQGYGFPGNAFQIPGDIPVRACDTPTNVVAKSTACGITVTWDEVEGAFGYSITSSFSGGTSSTFNVTAPGYATTWTAGDITWNYQVRAFCSNVWSDVSGSVSAKAQPNAAPGPSNIRVTSTSDGLSFTWDAVSGYDVSEYGVIFWDQNTMAFLEDFGVSGTSAKFGGLKAGDRVAAAVETWAKVNGDLCAGLPQAGQGVIVGGVMPPAPSGLRVATIKEGATVQLTFTGDDTAYSYGFYTRSLLENNGDYLLGGYTSSVPCIEVSYLFPGAWNYEFCVIAYNGNYSSPMSNCVRGPKDITAVGDCPAASSPVATLNPNPTVTWSNPKPTVTAKPTSIKTGSRTSSVPTGLCTGSPRGCGLGVTPPEPSGSWLAINCSHGSLTDALAPGPDQWKDADAGDAWSASLDFFEGYKKEHNGLDGFQFSQIIAQSVHATTDRLCLNIPDTNCDVQVQCDSQTGGVATGVSSPAGYLVINSMANIHNIIDGLDGALQNAAQDVAGTSLSIASDFEAFTNSDLKIELDIFTIIFSLVQAPVWNSWLKKISNFNKYSNTAGTMKDTISALTSNGVSFAKDTMSTDPVLASAAQFADIAQHLALKMRAVNNNTCAQIFSGDNTSYINDLIKDGGSAGASQQSPFNIESKFYASIVAMLIPSAWEISDVKYPILLNADGLERKGDICDPGSYDLANQLFNSKGDAKKSFVCIGNTPYWLAQGTAHSCTHNGMSCKLDGGGGYEKSDTLINPVVGIEKLDGNSFGGLTANQLAESSVNAFKANNGKNGWAPINVMDPDTLEKLADIGMSTAGVFNVPICSFDEALNNLNKGPLNYDEYPCNKP